MGKVGEHELLWVEDRLRVASGRSSLKIERFESCSETRNKSRRIDRESLERLD